MLTKHLSQPYFNFVKIGLKKYEVRCSKSPWNEIKMNDNIKFFCENEEIIVNIRNVTKYKDFDALFDANIDKLWHIIPGHKTKDSIKKIYDEIYHDNKLEVLLFELTLI